MGVLVIGGAGCLGAAVAALLVAAGRSVRSLDLVPCGVTGVQDVVGDLRDPQALRRALEGIDGIVFCAAVVGLHPRSADEMWSVNVDGLRTVIDAARRAGVGQLAYAGSQVVALDGSPLRGVEESVPCSARPVSTFAKGRIASERLVLQADGPSLRCSVVRVPILYGPRERYNLPTVLAALGVDTTTGQPQPVRSLPRMGQPGIHCAQSSMSCSGPSTCPRPGAGCRWGRGGRSPRGSRSPTGWRVDGSAPSRRCHGRPSP